MNQTLQKSSPVRLPWYRSLWAKLCLAQLVLLLLLGTLVVLLLLRFSRSFWQESEQLVNWGLAAELSTAVKPLVSEGVDYLALEKRFFDITTLHPRIRLFLLDQNGRILLASVDGNQIVRKAVSLKPIETFLQAAYAAATPILGDDPTTGSTSAIFSAATIPLLDDKGYLYILFDSGQNTIVTDVLETSYIARSSFTLLLIFMLLVWAVGALTFYFLTKPLAKMTAAVRMLAIGDYSKRVQYRYDDELGLLAQAYNSMADSLIETVRKLESTDKLRRELVANVAHDLRGPLTVAYGYLETISLNDVTLSDTARERAIDAASRNVRSLCRLVDSLFELAAIEARDSAPQMRPVGLLDFFESLILRFEPLAAEKHVVLHSSTIQPDWLVLGDPGLLERAVSNLLDNAIKYSCAGGVVSLNALADSNGVRIEVGDTGEGIPKEDLERIFETFYRSSATANVKQGTGLGLAIAQRIIKLHGSQLNVESSPGTGSSFYFFLPLMPSGGA